MKYTVILCGALAGCALHNPNVTQDQANKDKWECEQQAYTAMQGRVGLASNGLYIDCMHARGYK